MKLRDAARCGKASEAIVERIQAAIDKLEARKTAALKALESIPAINESLAESFAKWIELIEELDPDGDLGGGPGEPPTIDREMLTDAIESAFSDARDALTTEIESYEEIVQNAAEYVEPEEEEEEEPEEEDDEIWYFECDHPGCKVEIEVPSLKEEGRAFARSAGWDIEGSESFCPKHAKL